jgi:hypothetical protein
MLHRSLSRLAARVSPRLPANPLACAAPCSISTSSHPALVGGGSFRSYSSSAPALGGKKSKKRRDDPRLVLLKADRVERVRKVQTKEEPYTLPVTKGMLKNSEKLFKYASADSVPEVFSNEALYSDDSVRDEFSEQAEFNVALQTKAAKQTGNNRSESIRQLRFQTAVAEAMTRILESDAFAAGGMLSYFGDTIEIIDVKISPDLRHATLIYALPDSVPVKQLTSVQETIRRQLAETGVVRYLQGALTKRVRSQYAIRLRFVEGFDNEDGEGNEVAPDLGRLEALMDQLEDESREFKRLNPDVEEEEGARF